MTHLAQHMPPWWPADSSSYLLAAGGIVLALLGIAVLRRMFRRRRGSDRSERLVEQLDTYPPPPPLLSPEKRITVHSLPVRLRLIVAAPLGREAESMPLEDVDFLLDGIVPDLPTMARADLPRIRVWPVQLSHQGFIAAFRRNTRTPHPEARSSRWVLLAGKVLFEGKPFGLGLAFLADKVNTLGMIEITQPHEWMRIVRLEDE